jgi:long-subunit fatty acid transport protein
MIFYEGDEASAIHQITEDVDGGFEEEVFDDIIETESEITSGPTFNIGVLYRAGQHFRIGGTVRTAMNLTYEGFQIRDNITIDDSDTLRTISDVPFVDEYDLPPSFGLGASFTQAGLTAAVDGRFTDWSQISFGDLPIYNRGFRESYDDKFSLNVGAEYLIGTSPFRVRAGYIYDPVPFRLYLDPSSPTPTEVEVDREQQFVTFGGGVLVESVLTLDVAFQFGSFTRESALYSEERELSRLYLSSAIRF